MSSLYLKHLYHYNEDWCDEVHEKHCAHYLINTSNTLLYQQNQKSPFLQDVFELLFEDVKSLLDGFKIFATGENRSFLKRRLTQRSWDL